MATLKSENDMYREKIKELEKWLIMFLNNFYEGDPNSLRNIEQVYFIHFKLFI